MDLLTSWADPNRAHCKASHLMMRCRQKSISQITHSSLTHILSIQSIDCAYQRRDNKAAARNSAAVQVNYSTEIESERNQLISQLEQRGSGSLRRADKRQIIRLVDHELRPLLGQRETTKIKLLSVAHPEIGICSPAWSLQGLSVISGKTTEPQNIIFTHTTQFFRLRSEDEMGRRLSFYQSWIQSTPIRVMWCGWWSSARRSDHQYLKLVNTQNWTPMGFKFQYPVLSLGK